MPPYIRKACDVGIGLRKIVACSHSSSHRLLVSTVFGMMSSLHATSDLYTCFTSFYAGLASTVNIRELVDSLCRDDADMPMPPYIRKKLATTPTLHLLPFLGS